MKIEGYSDIGRERKENQDAFYLGESWAVIADGMGGHNGGEIASNATVAAIRTHLEATPWATARVAPTRATRLPEEGNIIKDIIPEIKEAIYLANEIVLDLGKDDPGGMGTTVVLAYISENKAYIASVGDSRAYLIHKDKMKQITTDHTMVNTLLEIGKITENQMSTHPQKNLLTRAVGTDNNIEIDTFEISLQKGDVLLICTDGLTNAISDIEILELIRSGAKQKKMCEIASKRSGKDNCTVIIMEV